MNKKILFSLFLLFFLITLSSCAKKEQIEDPIEYCDNVNLSNISFSDKNTYSYDLSSYNILFSLPNEDIKESFFDMYTDTKELLNQKNFSHIDIQPLAYRANIDAHQVLFDKKSTFCELFKKSLDNLNSNDYDKSLIDKYESFNKKRYIRFTKDELEQKDQYLFVRYLPIYLTICPLTDNIISQSLSNYVLLPIKYEFKKEKQENKKQLTFISDDLVYLGKVLDEKKNS